VNIDSEAGIATACQEARALGERLGFARAELAQLVTATAEVARNAWRHAGGGHVRLERVEDAARVGITVTAMDRGPGIADVEAAMRDGWSTAGSMGFGLPGARRLMDELEVSARTGGGTAVTMTRWRRKAGQDSGLPLVDWAAAPEPGSAGRRAVVRRFPGGVLIALTAGIGTGGGSQAAADTVASFLEGHASDSPIALVERCHGALASTPGAAIGLASLSGLDSRLTWLGVGDVTVVLHLAARPAVVAAPALPGAVGRWLPPLRAATLPVAPGDTLVLVAGRSRPIEDRDALTADAPLDVAKRLVGDGMVLVARRR
jgi:anti-sigma regulatory factor (Ser/Thr protein kinase)